VVGDTGFEPVTSTM